MNVIKSKVSSVASVTRQFVLGFKDLSKEVAHWFQLKTKVWNAAEGVKSLTRKELETYYRVPKEVARVAPTILISALPLANYVMLPIAYYYPRQLLSSHFWNLQQKSQFPVEILQQKQKCYKPVFRILQAKLQHIKVIELQTPFQDAVYKLGSGSHPSCSEILALQDLFSKDIFSISRISYNHAKNLCRMHGVYSGLWRRKTRLYKTAEIIQNLDAAIKGDGLDTLRTDELRSACFLRGLNGSNCSEEDMKSYMSKWIEVTESLEPDAHSLILHLPIFLGYNNMNNWAIRL